MSRAWTWRNAILSTNLQATTKHVLMVISTHMNDMGGGCYPSVKTISQLASLSERSVCTHIEIAAQAGWLAIEKHGFNGQGWARHEYKALWPEGTESGSARQGTERRSQGTEPHDKKALNVVQSIELPKEPLKEHPKGEPDGFAEIWKCVWRRGEGKTQPRKPALKAYIAALKRGDKHEEILAAIKARAGVDKPDTEFAPHLSTWLNEERWKDVVAGNSRSAEEIAAASKRHEEAAQRSKAHLDNLARQRSNQLLGLSDDAA